MSENVSRKRRRGIEAVPVAGATPVGGGGAVPVAGGMSGKRAAGEVVEAGDSVPARDPAANAFTTKSRGGTSWAAAGGYSLRQRREAAIAAGETTASGGMSGKGKGKGLPAPRKEKASSGGEGLPVPSSGSSSGGRGLPLPDGDSGSSSRGGAGLPAPRRAGRVVARPVGEGNSDSASSVTSSGAVPLGDDSTVTQGRGGGLPVRAVGEEGSSSGRGSVVLPSPGEQHRVERSRVREFIAEPQSVPSSFVAAEDDWDEVDDEVVNERRERAMSAASKRGIRITPRDIVIIQFLARYRFAAHHQVARYIKTSEKATSIRLHKLAEGKIVHKVEVTHGRNVWTPTADGIAIADVDMPAIRPQDVALSTMAHELGLVNLGIELELGGENVLLEEGWPHLNRMDEDSGDMVQGERVLTTREIRQASMRFRKGTTRQEIMGEYQARFDEWDGSTGYPSPELIPGNEGMFVMYSDAYKDHTPDMVVMRDRLPDGRPQSVAVELELSRKPEQELVRILKNFQESMLFDKLYYFCHKKAVMLALKRVNEREVGIPDDKFRILRYQPTKSKDPFWG